MKIIPVCKPKFLNNKILKDLKNILESGWITSGPKVKELEKELEKYLNIKNAIVLSNCTSALFLSLLVSGIKAGDEVIVPSFTFIATANAVKHIGANPVFADIDKRTFNLDIKEVEKLITKKTKAIILVHQMGVPGEIDEFNKLCKKYNLKLIEDAACALGSVYKNKKIGNSKNICCFSFHPRKIVSTGEGGLITTNNIKFSNKIRSLISHGETIDDIKRHTSKKSMILNYSNYGYNFRMSDIQAVLGIHSLGKIEDFIEQRYRFAEIYKKNLNLNEIEVPFIPNNVKTNYQSYCVILKHKTKQQRNRIVTKLREQGILATLSIQPIHRQRIYKKYKKGSMINTNYVSDKGIILPMHNNLKKKDIVLVSKILNKLLEEI